MSHDNDIIGADACTLAVAFLRDKGGPGHVRIGTAILDESDASINCCSVLASAPDIDWAVELIKAQCSSRWGGTSSILAARGISEDALAALAKPLHGDEAEFSVTLKAARSFTPQAAKRYILDLHVVDLFGTADSTVGESAGLSRTEKAKLLSGVIRMDDEAMMSALGGLLDHCRGTRGQRAKAERGKLGQKARGTASQTPAAGVTISALREFSLDQTLVMDTATAVSLGVVPDPARGAQATLLSHLDRTRTAMGKRVLRQWLLRPSTDLLLINMRLDAVEEIKGLHRSMPSDVHRLKKTMQSDLSDTSRLLREIAAARASPSTWMSLHRSVEAMRSIGSICSSLADRDDSAPSSSSASSSSSSSSSSSPTRSFAGSIGALIFSSDAVASVLALFQGVFELDSLAPAEMRELASLSIAAGPSLPVRPGVDKTLDQLRRLQEDVPAFLEHSLQAIAQTHADLDGASLHFLPQMGYLLAVDHSNGSRGWVPSAFTHVFDNDEKAYYRCDQTRVLDDTVGDVHSLIREREQAVMRSVEMSVIRHQAELSMISEALGELDVITTLAEVAEDCHYCRPLLTEEPVLDLRKSRHPLAEMLLRDDAPFVPNDVSLGGSATQSRVAILTGANGSGKSILLKQVGLAAVMAHMGSFVPADSATIGLIDRIFSQARQSDTVTSSHGSFTTQACSVTRMLRYSTSRSLLLVDEFGKGTCSIDGASLLAAALRHLLNRAKPGEEVTASGLTPRTIAVTHFREATQAGILASSVVGAPSRLEAGPAAWVAGVHSLVARMHMKVLVARPSVAVAGIESVQPLFQLVNTSSSDETANADASYGLACARASGLPERLLARAVNVMHAMESGRAVLPTLIEQPLEVNEDQEAFGSVRAALLKLLCCAQP